MAILRPAQQQILNYQGGWMAVSAVPGSGKTFTLSLLAAELLASGRVQAAAGQQVLIVTYLNASVEAFRARIRKRLLEMGRPLEGFDVRTLHSLSLEIVRTAAGGSAEGGAAPVIVDEAQSNGVLVRAVDGWIEAHPGVWQAFLPDNSPLTRVRWRETTERMMRSFIRTAKNGRYRPGEIVKKLEFEFESDSNSNSPLLLMLAGIYGRYQAGLARQGALDFDDVIWQAADYLEQRPDLQQVLRGRWPYILEDEAQDSVPLQEILLTQLVGPGGNWVRVGDPNQAITSTFTAAHPRYFNAFMDRPDVTALPLPDSGRCAPLILNAANTLVHWVHNEHPVPEVRQRAFRVQAIRPAPPGDAQPNPPDETATIVIKVYGQRDEEELPAIAQMAYRYTKNQPDNTVAILVPTNVCGARLCERLDALDAPYDNLLRGGGREREVAAVLGAILALLADPQDIRQLSIIYHALYELGHEIAAGTDVNRLEVLLRSVHSPETLLFPLDEGGREFEVALPVGVASAEELAVIERFVAFLQRLFGLRVLPADELVLAIADEVFSGPGSTLAADKATGEERDLAVAYHLATFVRQWQDAHPEWRLPEIAVGLVDVAAGRQRLPPSPPEDLGFEPVPGRITVATQHGAKGLEWDAVFLVGIDGWWIPNNLDGPFMGDSDFLGGNATAESVAQLRLLMAGDGKVFAGRTATESAHIELIGERLRLLYVGITRARRYLHISRSRTVGLHSKQREVAAAEALGELHRYLNSRRP